jgi:hypothetical protein
MSYNIGSFEITYLKEKVRRLDAFKESERYLGDTENPSDESFEMLVENIRTSIEKNDYSNISNFDFCELRMGSHVIMEKFTNKWVMERRARIIKNMDE